MFRGNFSAKIDGKGRLRVPNVFRAIFQEQFSLDLFVTSVTGESVRIYPMSVWIALEEKLADVPSTHPARTKFSTHVNFFGQPAELDKQGRVMIHPRLREAAHMVGDVDVFGQLNHLEVWNHDRFLEKLKREPYTDDDARALSGFGI